MDNENEQSGQEAPAPIVENTPAPVVPISTPPVDETATPLTPSPIIERYATKLKAELGENYSTKFDKMTVEARIDAMEATIDVMKKSNGVEPLQKPDGEIPLGEPAPIDNKPKSFLKLQQSEGYGSKMRKAGSYAQIAKNLYGK